MKNSKPWAQCTIKSRKRLGTIEPGQVRTVAIMRPKGIDTIVTMGGHLEATDSGEFVGHKGLEVSVERVQQPTKRDGQAVVLLHRMVFHFKNRGELPTPDLTLVVTWNGSRGIVSEAS